MVIIELQSKESGMWVELGWEWGQALGDGPDSGGTQAQEAPVRRPGSERKQGGSEDGLKEGRGAGAERGGGSVRAWEVVQRTPTELCRM